MKGIEDLHMVGGSLCLDFANSVSWHAGASPQDNLRDYRDLLTWCRRAGVLDADQAEALADRATAEPEAARRALVDARRLRESIYRLFTEVIDGVGEPGLAAFSVFFERAMRFARLTRTGSSYRIDFASEDRLDAMLAPIAWSAAELLRGGDLGRVKRCGKDPCGWLFVDRSKNRSRRWCEMSECGNDEKARRFHQKRSGRHQEV